LLRYPRAPDSREWTMPMTAVKDITRLPAVSPGSVTTNYSNPAPGAADAFVLCLHKRMIHAPENVMCYAVQDTKPLWKNTNVTVENIRLVSKHSPCLTYVLAKKRNDGAGSGGNHAKSLRCCVSAGNNRILRIGNRQPRRSWTSRTRQMPNGTS